MAAENTVRNARVTVYTTPDIKEKIDNHFQDCKVNKQPFLSDTLEDLVTDVDFFTYVLNYQIQKTMRKRISKEALHYLTGEEAKKIVIIDNQINSLLQDKYLAKGDEAKRQMLQGQIDALNDEKYAIKTKADERLAETQIEIQD